MFTSGFSPPKWKDPLVSLLSMYVYQPRGLHCSDRTSIEYYLDYLYSARFVKWSCVFQSIKIYKICYFDKIDYICANFKMGRLSCCLLTRSWYWWYPRHQEGFKTTIIYTTCRICHLTRKLDRKIKKEEYHIQRRYEMENLEDNINIEEEAVERWKGWREVLWKYRNYIKTRVFEGGVVKLRMLLESCSNVLTLYRERWSSWPPRDQNFGIG